MPDVYVNYDPSSELGTALQIHSDTADNTSWSLRINHGVRGSLKIHIPYICMEHTTTKNFGSQREMTSSQIVIQNKKDGRVAYGVEEFRNEFPNIFANTPYIRVGSLNQALVNIITQPSAVNSIIQLLQENAITKKQSDCWFPGTFDYDIIYPTLKESVNISPTPVDKVEKSNGKRHPNPRADPQHPLYTFLVQDNSISENIIKTQRYFEEFRSLILPESRLEFWDLMVDYFFASWLKNEMRQRKFGQVNFPVLCATGEKNTGKTWIAESLCRLVYGNADDENYQYNKTMLQGTSPLTRIKLQNNNVFPIILDEIDDLGKIQTVVNLYLTQGCFSDQVSSREKPITRTAFFTPIILTNNIQIRQYGNEAILDRFAFYHIEEEPDTSSHNVRKATTLWENKFINITDKIGATLMTAYMQNKKDIENYINKKLDEDYSEALEQCQNRRHESKARFFLIGRALKEWFYNELFTNGLESFNRPHFYVDLVHNNRISDSIITNSDTVKKKVHDLLYRPAKDYREHNVYFDALGTMDATYTWQKSVKPACDELNDDQLEKDEELQSLLKIFYYLERELGLTPSTEPGWVVVSKKFLQMLHVEGYNFTKSKFAKHFKDYTKTIGSTNTYLVSRIGENEDRFEPNIMMKSDVLKFNIEKYFSDNS